jgi:transcription-repair coupling factor (superfamily II helicase)
LSRALRPCVTGSNMTLRHLVHTLKQTTLIKHLLSAVEKGDRIVVDDLPVAARPALIGAIADHHNKWIVVLSGRSDRSEDLAMAVEEFVSPVRRCRVWPAPETVPYERLPSDPATSADRIEMLTGLGRSQEPEIMFASAAGLSHAVTSAKDLASRTLCIEQGSPTSLSQILEWAMNVGYELVTVVQRVGEIARRGGIIDIFPPGTSDPIRLDFFGDELDTIRRFDSSSQRSHERINGVTLSPAIELPVWKLPEAASQMSSLELEGLRPEVREEFQRMLDKAALGVIPSSPDIFAPYLLDQPETLVSHLPDDALVILDDPATTEFAGRQHDAHASEHYAAALNSRELPPGLPDPFIRFDDVMKSILHRQTVALGTPEMSNGPWQRLNARSWTVPGAYGGRVANLAADLRRLTGDGWKVCVATDQVDRLSEILESCDLFPRRTKHDTSGTIPPLESGHIEVLPSSIDGGFLVDQVRLVLITDLEIYGFHKRVRAPGRRRRESAREFATSLTPGDIVVHVDHGVARFSGLVRIEHGGVEREYLLLEFAKGDKLYVPVDQSHRVTLYSSGGLLPALSTLGSGEWVRTKRRVRRAVRDMAYELLSLYAARDSSRGHVFGPDSTWDLELASSFPFAETVDQASAIADVKADMSTDRPMDRLICGDVGFGKTEIAIRAAFKAVHAGKQVAVLVPTTVLALQHFTTFSQRLAAYPVRIDMLSRLRSDKEQREVVDGLHQGSVDIVIGTHRLIQRDVSFRDLGLAVVDEEQRFGVRQKEFLKQLRNEVDIITMSATPIPRTLHIALAGIRDISIIETAPQARLPIRTFVTETNDHLIREVVLREIDRGGQVFFVHNRVQTIGRTLERLRRLLPEARFGVGHGQMDEEVLESVMLKFVAGEFDVLVCTTIIESGVDIQNANTIVIDNADAFGLTQLYQLRGRVGRGSHRAYAYLFYRPGKHLTADALARLEAIQEATELGAGLKVALRDMEIRGAGNILGAEQSGHIAEIGYELYLRLLAQAVEEAKLGKPVAEQRPITMDLPLTALIPAAYIQDVELRLSTYRSIAGIEDNRGVNAMREELRDRFGEPPVEVERLLALIGLRIRCQELGIESVVEREREIVIHPIDTGTVNTQKLIAQFGHAIKVTPRSVRLRLPELEVEWSKALDLILEEIEASASSFDAVGAVHAD